MKVGWLMHLGVVIAMGIQTQGSFPLGAAVVAMAGSAFFTSFDRLKCTFYECCSPSSKWINANMTALNINFNTYLHGQHLVKKVVMRALMGHVKDPTPSKALVLSFHGWTGAGKNHVARLIANSLYDLGMKSQYVHTFMSTIHFPYDSKADIYKLHLQDWIRSNVSMCERSMFIFDEIDKMPVGMISGIKPFIDYHESIDGVDYRKNIFLFLSNTGGPEITREVLKWWHDGKNREDISMKELEHLIQRGAFNEKGGLHNSDLIQHNLVDHYIPFLPLERSHVELCIEDNIRQRGISPKKSLVQKVADEMMYFPPENLLFSTTGCKKVAQKVSFILAMEDYDRFFN